MILDRAALLGEVRRRRAAGEVAVLTNGCFDLLHVGHVRTLQAARALGDYLIVGVNTDAGVRRLDKSGDRPIVPEAERCELLDALACVDYVTLFDEPTALELCAAVGPEIYIKSEEYLVKPLPEREVVEAAGGVVKYLPVLPGHSTSDLIRRIVAASA